MSLAQYHQIQVVINTLFLEEAQKAQIIKVNFPRNVLPNDHGLAECIKVCEGTKWHRILVILTTRKVGHVFVLRW